MKILVTGSRSFVGKSLMPLLQGYGYEVYGITRTGSTSKNQLIGDLSCSSTYEDLPKDIEAVVHLAAVTSPPDYSVNNLFLNNTESTRLLINFSKKVGVSHFIYASSVSVYGDVNEAVLTEDHSIMNPSPYGLSKLAGEMLLKDTANDFVSFSLRLPAIIGKGATRHWLSKVYQKLLENEEIDIYNPDSGFNNCIHVENLCSYIVNILGVQKAGSHVVNLGCTETISIKECIFFMANLLKYQPKVKLIDHDKQSFTINFDRAREYGFEPWTVKNSLQCWIS